MKTLTYKQSKIAMLIIFILFCIASNDDYNMQQQVQVVASK